MAETAGEGTAGLCVSMGSGVIPASLSLETGTDAAEFPEEGPVGGPCEAGRGCVAGGGAGEPC